MVANHGEEIRTMRQLAFPWPAFPPGPIAKFLAGDGNQVYPQILEKSRISITLAAIGSHSPMAAFRKKMVCV